MYLLFKSGSKRSLKFALLISIGIIASTSGMGIMLSVAYGDYICSTIVLEQEKLKESGLEYLSLLY